MPVGITAQVVLCLVCDVPKLMGSGPKHVSVKGFSGFDVSKVYCTLRYLSHPYAMGLLRLGLTRGLRQLRSRMTYEIISATAW